MTLTVSTSTDPAVVEPIARRWAAADLVARIWQKDPTVWFDPPRPETANRLGWLDLPTSSRRLIATIESLAADATERGITDIVLCGMGGSSLAPEVFAATLPVESHHPSLTVIDSTHPDAVMAVSDAIDPGTTWFIVSSKSGSTLETMSLFRHFWALTSEVTARPGDHFIAITDPGSSLEALADERDFAATVLADPDVGGRYSALTAFGLVPAGLIGADVGRLLDAATDAAGACAPELSLEDNAGFRIGVALGTASGASLPTAYFDASGPATHLPIWVEQLIAESTGKEDRGILPVADGPPVPGGSASIISIGSDADAEADVAIAFDDPYDIAGAMFLLEFATAVAGEILGIQPFDQPDVQLAKTLAHQAMEGSLDVDIPVVSPDADTASVLANHADRSPAYISVQAYLPASRATDEALNALRRVLAQRSDRYVTLGYGPRFLHSTGQLHKGGPPGGLFLQLVDTPSHVTHVPETDSTFNQLVEGQAAGDRAALADRGRTVMSVHLDAGAAGVREFADLVENA